MHLVKSAAAGTFPDYDQTATPSSPSSGEFWWDRNIHVLKRYDGSDWQWVGLDDLANVSTGGKSDGSGLLWDTDGDPDAWIDGSVGGGGGGGTTWLDPIASGNAPGGSDDDEFADDSLAAGWTEVTASGSATWVEGADVLSVRYSGQSSGDLTAQLLSLSISTGTVIETAVRMLGTNANSVTAGLCFADGTTTGSKLMGASAWRVSGQDRLNLRGGTFTDWSTDLGGTTDAHMRLAPWLHLRVTYVSSNTWRAEFSPDGQSWMDFGIGDGSFTMTPTHVGVFAGSYGGSTGGISTFEYLRVS